MKRRYALKSGKRSSRSKAMDATVGLGAPGVFLPAVYYSFGSFRNAQYGHAVACAIMAFGLVIYIRWELRARLWFWAAMVILAALQSLLLWNIPWSSKWVPAAVFAASASLDFVLILWIVAYLERRVGDNAMAKR